ncbi:hypothetical protein BDZ45DRAFT_471782 [Acephala macrosclerotiorum]|nr:hypothetical protein BDZ45DRAFT_471782 [Acephala macrosclerotiorum]
MARSSQDPNNPWFYNPSLAAAIIIARIYLMTTAFHIFQAFHYRTRLCITLVVGGVWETMRYTIRAVSAQHEESIALYATQLSLIVLAPVFAAAFNYMLFGRLLRTYSLGAKALGITAAWVTRIFISFDAIPSSHNQLVL